VLVPTRRGCRLIPLRPARRPFPTLTRQPPDSLVTNSYFACQRHSLLFEHYGSVKFPSLHSDCGNLRSTWSVRHPSACDSETSVCADKIRLWSQYDRRASSLPTLQRFPSAGTVSTFSTISIHISLGRRGSELTTYITRPTACTQKIRYNVIAICGNY
jgi:hypothetical protein